MSTEIRVQVSGTFPEAVMADVKGTATPEQTLMLHRDINNWLECLRSLIRDVDIQFSARKAQSANVRSETFDNGDESGWLAYQATDKDWRLKANRFRASIESRMRYVKSLRVTNT